MTNEKRKKLFEMLNHLWLENHSTEFIVNVSLREGYLQDEIENELDYINYVYWT